MGNLTVNEAVELRMYGDGVWVLSREGIRLGDIRDMIGMETRNEQGSQNGQWTWKQAETRGVQSVTAMQGVVPSAPDGDSEHEPVSAQLSDVNSVESRG